MSDGAKAVWKSAIDSVSPDQLNELDRAALGAWATACDLYRQAQIGLDETGLVVKAPVTGTLVQSPYLAILNKQVSIIVRTATQLGFTPVSRARVKPVEAKIDPSNSWHDFVF
jgi:P27 family predicted phage terminase small subunit